MNAINTEQTHRAEKAVWLDTSQNPLKSLSIGDIITGTLTQTDSKRSTFAMESGASFQLDAKSVVAEIGQKLSFEVADVYGNSVVLKQINENKEAEDAEERENAELTGDELINWAKGAVLPITGRSFESSKILAENAAEQKQAARDILSKLKRDITFSINNVSGSALVLLADNGVSLDNATVAAFTAAVKSAVKGVSLESGGEETKAALSSYASIGGRHFREIVTALVSEDLPVTEANIGALRGVAEKAEEAAEMGIEAKISFLRRGQSPTVGNLFSAMHGAGSGLQQNAISEGDWNKMLDGVKKYFKASGIAESEENLNAARVLIENDIPVEKGSIELLTGGAKRRELPDIIKSAAANMANGKSPLGANIYRTDDIVANNPRELFEGYKRIIKELPDVTDGAIEASIASGEPVTIASLLSAHRNGNEGSGDGRRGERFVSEKIKLEEIRLRLTLTAASQMARAGVSIDTMELKEALDELKALEDKNNAAALEITGAEVNARNLREMSSHAEVLRGLQNTFDSVKRGIMRREIEFTAEKVAAENNGVRERIAKAGYESGETRPDAKFGDSVEKALKHVSALLETLGIAALPENVKAARSLVRTGTDITAENIEAIKAVNSKIDYVTQNLHPLISANMVKEAFNPLAVHIDEVIAYINKFNELYGEPPIEAAEKAIFNMDKRGELGKDERAALIGMYRALSTIKGNETAASAVIAKSGRALTLENLMEAGKYHAKSKSRHSVLDRKIDENDGGSDVAFAESSIRSQLEKAYSRSVSELAEKGVSEEVALKAAEDSNSGLTAQNLELLGELYQNETELNSQNINKAWNVRHSVERLAASLKNDNALSFYKTLGASAETTDIRELLGSLDEFLEKNAADDSRLNASESAAFSVFKEDLRSLADVSPQQLAWMLEMRLPLSIGNLKTVRGMANDADWLGKQVEELEQLAEEIADERLDCIPDTDLGWLVHGGSPHEIIEDIIERTDEIIEKSELSDSPEKVGLVGKASIIENAARILEKTRNNDNYFQIPIRLHDKIGSLNVYMLNENPDPNNMSGHIQLNLAGLGKVQANISISEGFADIVIGAEADASKFLSENSDILGGYLKELGLNDFKISFTPYEPVDYFKGGAETKQMLESAEAGTRDGERAVDVRL